MDRPVPQAVAVKRPTNPRELLTLRNSLKDLGLSRLYSITWNVTCDTYTRDFHNLEQQPEYQGTIRGKPELWTTLVIGKAFNCPSEGEIHISQRNSFCASYFNGAKDQSHGWRIKTCNNEDLKSFLWFIVPILRPKKPTYCPGNLANLLIAAWKGDLEVNWAYLLNEVIQDLVKVLTPGKKTYLLSYLAQLYRWGYCLTGEEATKRETLLKGIPDADADECSEDEIQVEALESVQDEEEDPEQSAQEEEEAEQLQPENLEDEISDEDIPPIRRSRARGDRVIQDDTSTESVPGAASDSHENQDEEQT